MMKNLQLVPCTPLHVGPTFVDYHLRLPTLWKLYANPLMLCGRTAVMEAKKKEKKMWLKLFLQSSFSLFQAAWRSMRLQPLSVFLVKNGQGGDRILFRYPYKVSTPKKATTFYGNASGTSGGGGGSAGVGDAILTG